MKINIQLVSNLLNNFLLIIKGNLLWSKPSNYALKLTNGKRVLNIMKNINNLQVVKPTLMRIQLQVFLDILNNFHLIIEKYVWNENVNILFIKEKKTFTYF